MNKITLSLLIVVVFILGIVTGYKTSSVKYRSEIIVLQGQVAIYQSQAEKYAQVIRTIRETAAQATVTEKAAVPQKAQ